MKIKALIIDDEKLARSRLQRMLNGCAEVEVIGEAVDGLEGLRLIEELHPDVIFLDIKMPGLSGFEMLGKLQKSPYIIFTTAYDHYALQAFEENTLDYLVKPISDEKLKRAISKAVDLYRQGGVGEVDLRGILQRIARKESIIRRFAVKIGSRIIFLQEDEICFIQAKDKYTFFTTAHKEYITSSTLKELAYRLDEEKFCQVSRSHIVNLAHIESMHPWFNGTLLLKMHNGAEIQVSRGRAAELKRRVNL